VRVIVHSDHNVFVRKVVYLVPEVEMSVRLEHLARSCVGHHSV